MIAILSFEGKIVSILSIRSFPSVVDLEKRFIELPVICCLSRCRCAITEGILVCEMFEENAFEGEEEDEEEAEAGIKEERNEDGV